jgi:hypothetical protein
VGSILSPLIFPRHFEYFLHIAFGAVSLETERFLLNARFESHLNQKMKAPCWCLHFLAEEVGSILTPLVFPRHFEYFLPVALGAVSLKTSHRLVFNHPRNALLFGVVTARFESHLKQKVKAPFWCLNFLAEEVGFEPTVPL